LVCIEAMVMPMTLGTSIASHAAVIALGAIAACRIAECAFGGAAIARRLHRRDLREDISLKSSGDVA
jgi:hypothetical protein